MPRYVEHHAEVIEDRRGWDGWPARERVDPGYQLGERERFREVVVGAEAEPVHPVADAAGRRQDQDPGPQRGVDHPSAHRVAGGFGHIAVEHGDVVAVDTEPLHRRLAVVTDVNGHRQLAQALGDGVREQPLVIGKEDTQASLLLARH
jgi:hypothetical protein